MRRNQNLTEKVTIKLTPNDLQRMDKQCAQSGISRSEYIRDMLLVQTDDIAHNQRKEIRTSVLRIASDLGKANKWLQSGDVKMAHEQYLKIEEEVYELCRTLV